MTGKTSIELRDEGAAALGRRDAEAAEAAYRALLEREPDNIHALIGLGSASRQRGQWDEALQRLQAAAAAWPKHPWPWLEIGGLHNAAGRPDEAEASLRRTLELSPGYYHALMALGRLLAKRGDRDGAVEMFRNAAQERPPQTGAFLALAEELAGLGRHDEAVAALDVDLDAGADRLALLRAKARTLRTAGRPAQALEVVQAALAALPDEKTLALEIASDLRALGRPAEAMATCQGLLDDPQSAASLRRDAALAAGRLARDALNDRPAAIGFFERAVAEDPDHAPAAFELAGAYRQAHRLAEAEAVYRRVLAREPAHVSALGGLAVVRRLSGDLPSALDLIETACALDPKHDWNRIERCTVLRELGRTAEAAGALEAIEPSSRVFAQAQTTLGHMARGQGDHRGSIAYFEQAAERAEDPTDALFHLAGSKRILGDFAGAGEVIERMLRRDGGSWRAHLADGILKRAMNDRSGAREAFVRAAQLAPSEAQPQVEIAVEEIARGDLEAAAAALDLALELDPRHEDALFKRAGLLAERGDIKAALAVYAELRATRPGMVWAYLSAGQLLGKTGDSEGELRMLAEAREACRPSSQIDFREAAILRQQGLLDESYKRITAANQQFPLEFWPWYGRTEAAINLGDFPTAAALLAAQPSVEAVAEQGHALKLRAQFEKAQWNLEAAIGELDAAIALDAQDAAAYAERAKLKLITCDTEGAWQDLKAQAAALSVGAKRKKNPLHSLTGQIYEEYAMDRILAAQLSALRGVAPRDQIEPIAGLVRAYRDSTAPAIGLMIALRCSGRFNSPWNSAAAAAARIPRLITQFWNDREPPADVSRLMTSWDGVDTGFRIDRFDDVSALAYLRERYPPAVARAFGRTGEPAQRADLFRLARLYAEGGYFIDADDRARGGLDATLPRDAEFVAYQEELGSIGNNVLGAIPRHPVIEWALKAAVTGILRGDRDLVWLTTGPGLLTRALANWLAESEEQLEARLASVAVLTLAEMRQAAAMHCNAAYKNTDRAWLSGAFRKATTKRARSDD